jgi:thiamine-monophosphate kinase
MLTEFGIISRYFTGRQRHTQSLLGIGDDCALLAPASGHALAVSTDMLVAGRHFFADVDPAALGHKALAVNLSDLAAMGAAPRAFTLALALPEADPAWLQAFSDGLFGVANRFGCELIGGDTTAGPLNICITVFGDVTGAGALTRAGALVDDDVWVSGALGDARLALGALRGEWPLDAAALREARAALERPTPRVALGLALRGLASAALDISDGLAGDLRHIVEASKLDAMVDADALPCSPLLAGQAAALRRQCTMAGGDDYELCFTAPAAARAEVVAAGLRVGVPVTRIGKMTRPAPGESPAMRWRDGAGAPLDSDFTGFDHFHAD